MIAQAYAEKKIATKFEPIPTCAHCGKISSAHFEDGHCEPVAPEVVSTLTDIEIRNAYETTPSHLSGYRGVANAAAKAERARIAALPINTSLTDDKLHEIYISNRSTNVDDMNEVRACANAAISQFQCELGGAK
ncbi:hypothetical protein [Solimicrobium silvestre]|uniref:Uncharacterized protein n=1 Tax=Solimicrobium silvestre TaxID=2099400 RepID=A0A2S9GY33_9BURK|nr:hypothetical protein [Solimicrobium silvestre]PRC92621.1 hypothetical protein S2091_2676 [Solimicrobium silvestre]